MVLRYGKHVHDFESDKNNKEIWEQIVHGGVKRKKENGYEDIFKKDDNSEYGVVT